jgi:hypothetical protein
MDCKRMWQGGSTLLFAFERGKLQNGGMNWYPSFDKDKLLRNKLIKKALQIY